ncbi:MAG: hypothetical protein WD069_21870 [Planctomycetales bacterium]
MGRAPTFWNDETVELLKENFVCAAVPTQVCRTESPEGEFLRTAGIDKQWVTSSGYFSCVSPGGKTLVAGGDVRRALEEFRKLPEAQRKAGGLALSALEAGDEVVPSPPENGLVLRVHARFLARDEKGELRYAKRDDFRAISPAFLEPNTEYMWLTEDEWKALVPENPTKGQKLPVSSAISNRMARFHLNPQRALTSESSIVAQQNVKTADLALVVDEVTPDRIRMGVAGFIHWGSTFDAAKATSPNGPLGYGYETPIHGTVEYDRKKQEFVRFDMIAPGDVWGRWGDANGNSQGVERAGRAPVGFAFELVTGDSPTDRLPPGGNGERALKAGYFSTGG